MAFHFNAGKEAQGPKDPKTQGRKGLGNEKEKRERAEKWNIWGWTQNPLPSYITAGAASIASGHLITSSRTYHDGTPRPASAGRAGDPLMSTQTKTLCGPLAKAPGRCRGGGVHFCSCHIWVRSSWPSLPPPRRGRPPPPPVGWGGFPPPPVGWGGLVWGRGGSQIDVSVS
jgi:hypothetical protein